jgi:hypothetical protein
MTKFDDIICRAPIPLTRYFVFVIILAFITKEVDTLEAALLCVLQ